MSVMKSSVVSNVMRLVLLRGNLPYQNAAKSELEKLVDGAVTQLMKVVKFCAFIMH